MSEPLETVLSAIGPHDDNKTELLVDTVLQVAIPADATVVLVHVFTPDQFDEIVSELDFPDATTEDADTVSRRIEPVRELEQRFNEHNIDCEIRGVVGDISETLCSTATEIDADRVVISGSSTTPVGKALFGSTAQDVLLNAPCPVTYVRAQNTTE